MMFGGFRPSGLRHGVLLNDVHSKTPLKLLGSMCVFARDRLHHSRQFDFTLATIVQPSKV